MGVAYRAIEAIEKWMALGMMELLMSTRQKGACEKCGKGEGAFTT